MPGLIASDVDGTLLDPMDAVTPRTAAAVSAVVAAGVPFVLVTGRPPRWIPGVAQAAGLTGYAVCGNGAVLYDIGRDQVLRTHVIEPITLGDVVHTVARLIPDTSIAVERIGVSANALAGHEFLVEPGYRHPWAERTPVAPRAELIGRPAAKLLIRQPELTSQQLADAVGSMVDGMVDVTYSTDFGMIEISAAGVTKATGLAEIAEWLAAPTDTVVAFGDAPNDVSMLRWAGHGVAMGNAHPAVLAVADEITAANSADGVALVLERWFPSDYSGGLRRR